MILMLLLQSATCKFQAEAMLIMVINCLMQLLKQLRQAGIQSDIYPEAAKMKKQMEYANKRVIPYVVIVGESERLEGVATVKNMAAGEQQKVAFADLAKVLA